MPWEIHKRYKHARRNKETNICAKERALDNVIDQRISRAIITRRNLTRIVPDEIYQLDPTRASYSQSCNILMWCVYNGGPYKMPKLADWPKEKISKAALFTYTGLDYIVAFYVKENEEKKVWICIFTCVTVRAVHLEIVYGMKAEQFFMALQRFISRRNTPDTIILDNVPQFKLTKTTLDKAWQQPISHENMQRFTSHVRIKWKFIIEFSPWMGGFYERLVGMVKSSLRKVIQIKFLTTTQFRTYAIECEHILNSRLLVYIDDDISSTEAIKPNHFLCLNPQNLAPILEDDGNPDFKPQMESSNELLEIWRKGQSYLNEFW